MKCLLIDLEFHGCSSGGPIHYYELHGCSPGRPMRYYELHGCNSGGLIHPSESLQAIDTAKVAIFLNNAEIPPKKFISARSKDSKRIKTENLAERCPCVNLHQQSPPRLFVIVFENRQSATADLDILNAADFQTVISIHIANTSSQGVEPHLYQSSRESECFILMS